MSIDLAIIGGSGLYDLPGLSDVQRYQVSTPFGAPSSEVAVGRVGDASVAFLARHGEVHRLAPHRVNYRANVHALADLGARRILGINAVGGIRADMAPRVMAVPDQIIDYTYDRATSFCDVEGVKVEHVDFSEPYSSALRGDLIAAAARAKVAVVDGGCHGVTQGPRLETSAEIRRLRRDGCDLVGMTGMPEAVLARELGIEYACLAMVANWAAGCGDAPSISIDEIFEHLKATTANVPLIVAALLSA